MNFRLIVPFLVLLASCVVKEEENINHTVKSKPRYIVLIFDNFPADHKIHLNDTQKSAYTLARFELRYFDDHFIQRVLKPKVESRDTIQIEFDRETIEMQHSVRAIDNYEYIFQRGDTVLFTYEDKIPSARVINRNVSEYELNYDLKFRQQVCPNDYPAMVKLITPYMFITYNAEHIGSEGEKSGIAGQIDMVRATASVRFTKELQLEQDYIDSLFSASLISYKSSEWLKQKLYLKDLTKAAYQDNLNLEQINQGLANNDSLLGYHAYRFWLSQLRDVLYERKVKRIVTRNSNLADYRIVYDSIERNKIFMGKLKDVLLFETSDLLFQNGKPKENKVHANRMKLDINDSILVNHLLTKYQLEIPASNEIHLISMSGETISLAQVLKKNFGKVVFVDIWASWCGPCIQEFPASKDLRSKLKGQNVVFVYLSIDDEREKWKASSVRNNLPATNSFLIENKLTSTTWSDLDVQSIPRYLIYNSNGDLEIGDGPRPSSPQALEIIQKLLNQ